MNQNLSSKQNLGPKQNVRPTKCQHCLRCSWCTNDASLSKFNQLIKTLLYNGNIQIRRIPMALNHYKFPWFQHFKLDAPDTWRMLSYWSSIIQSIPQQNFVISIYRGVLEQIRNKDKPVPKIKVNESVAIKNSYIYPLSKSRFLQHIIKLTVFRTPPSTWHIL